MLSFYLLDKKERWEKTKMLERDCWRFILNRSLADAEYLRSLDGVSNTEERQSLWENYLREADQWEEECWPWRFKDASPDPLVLSWAPGAARSAWVSSHRQCTVATPYFNDWKRFCAVLREIASGENGRPVSGVEAQKRAKSTHSNRISSNRGLGCRQTEFSGQLIESPAASVTAKSPSSDSASSGRQKKPLDRA